MTMLIVKELCNTTFCDTYIAVVPYRGVSSKEVKKLVLKAVRKNQRRKCPTSKGLFTAMKQAFEGKGRVLKYDIIDV